HCHSRPQLSITGSWRVITRRHPVIAQYLRRGERPICKHRSLPCQLLLTALYGSAQQSQW
ncbi:unnamed protein product, partial [Staurois parvus]